MTAELRARVTYATAALSDFRAGRHREGTSGARMDYPTAALTLAEALTYLLGALNEATAAPEEASPARTEPAAALDAGQLQLALNALDTAAESKNDLVDGCPDCDGGTSPQGLCGTCEWRMHLITGYTRLAQQLRNKP
jgi:hypothetical protein